MKLYFILALAVFASFSQAASDPTMKCQLGHHKEMIVYGPLGFFYEDDLGQSSEVSFPNRIELLINDRIVSTLANSTSMVNDHQHYTVTSYTLNVKDLTLQKVLNLFFDSAKGSEAHVDISVSNFRHRGKAYCHLIN